MNQEQQALSGVHAERSHSLLGLTVTQDESKEDMASTPLSPPLVSPTGTEEEEEVYRAARLRTASLHPVPARTGRASPSASAHMMDMSIADQHSEQDRVQASVFTKWINIQLAKADGPRQIDSIFEDLKSGVNLLLLLGVLTDQKFRVDQGSLRFTHIVNCERALDFLEKNQVLKAKNIGAANIVDGAPTLTLGLIWQILLRYQIVGGGMAHSHDPRKLLIDWVQSTLKTEGSGIEATSFTAESFQNGLAFNAILACHRPKLVNMAEVQAKPPVERLEFAFTTAQSELNVAPLLTPQDVAEGKADDKSIMVYTTELYNALPHDAPPSGAAAAAGDEADNPVAAALAQMEALNQDLVSAEEKTKGVTVGDDFHTVKHQLDEHQVFMKNELGQAKASQIMELQKSVPQMISKMPKSNPNKKKCQKALYALLTSWNTVNKEATTLQTELLAKLATLQDARLKTVEDWLDHLEKAQAQDSTLRPEVLKQRERELVDYQEVLSEVVMVDTSAEGKAQMDDRLAGIRQRWEVVNRFVVLRIIQHFQARMEKAVADDGTDIKELKSVRDSIPDHDVQREQLQDGIAKLKAEATSRHDPYLAEMDDDVKAMAGRWPELGKALDGKISTIELEQAKAKDWRDRAEKLNAFLNSANSGILHQPLAVHDLDAVTEQLEAHQALLKELDHQLQSVKDFDRSFQFSDPKLGKEFEALLNQLEDKWLLTRDLATSRAEELSKSQDQLQDFENRVEGIASFLNEIDSLFLKPFEELPREEQIALLDQLRSAKEKYDARKPGMAEVQVTSDDLVSRARAASFDPTDLESEVQMLVERWEDAEVLLDQRLASHQLGFADWVAELESKRNEIPTAKSLEVALGLVEGVNEEIQRSAYQFPEVQGRRNGNDHGHDNNGRDSPVARFTAVETSNDGDAAVAPDVKQVDAELAELLKTLEAVQEELDSVKKDKTITSVDEVKLLLERLEGIGGAVQKLEGSTSAVKQQANTVIAKCSPELATVVETFTEKALKKYADLEDEVSSEKSRLGQVCDLLEEMDVQERWLDVAEQCYPVQSNDKAKDVESLGREVDEHSPEFERMAALLPDVKSGVDEKSMSALEQRFSDDMERFTNLRVAAGKVSAHLATYLASCAEATQKMEDIETSLLTDPEDAADIQAAVMLMPQLQAVDKDDVPALSADREGLEERRDQLDKILIAKEKVQAHDAYADVEARLTALPPAVGARRRELEPFVAVEEETIRLEAVVESGTGELDELQRRYEDKAEDLERLVAKLESEQTAIDSVVASSGGLKENSGSSPRSCALHERVEKLQLGFSAMMERAREDQDTLAGVSLKELLKRCGQLLLVGDKLLASLGSERPVATDISALQDQFGTLKELQDLADKAQGEGAELSALIRVQPEKVQTATQDQLDELDLKLTKLLDALMQRETDLEHQMEKAQEYNDELSLHVAYLEKTHSSLEGLVVTVEDSLELLTAVQRETETIAEEMAKKRVEIDCLDENLQLLMKQSLEDDCKETKSSFGELRQLFDVVMALLRDRILAARSVAELGPLNLSEITAEIAELREWLQAVEKWLLGQENESDTFSDPTKAEQQRQKYEAVKDDLEAKKATLEQINRDVALLLALNPPDQELYNLEESRKSVAAYYDEVWKMVDKLQRLLEKAMPQQMIGMSDWLVRVNDWLRAQNPGMAIANGADDAAVMLEDLRKCEMDLTDRNPIMKSINKTCESRLSDPEMTDEAKETLRQQLDVLQSNFEMTMSTVQIKQAWLQYYEGRGRKVREALTKHLLWFTEHDQNSSLFVNPAVDLPVLEKQIQEHAGFIASIHKEQANIVVLKQWAVVLMLQATSSSGPSTDNSPLSSPEDTSDGPSSFPPLPSCKLNEAITQLGLRLQSLLQKAMTHQHKLDDARQQLDELLASIAAFLEWIRLTELKISDPVGERNQILVLQKQLETCLSIKAELPTQLNNVEQINSNCSEFLDSSNGPDENSSFMKSMANLDAQWAQLQVKLETRQAEIEERMKGSSQGAIQFATGHAVALEWMICLEDQLSTAVAVNADLAALLDHNRQHTELVQRIPQRQAEVDGLYSQGESLLAAGQLSVEDRASVDSQMASLNSHWERITSDSAAKSQQLAAALLTVNSVYDQLKTYKEFILDAEDTLACADTIGGKNSEELQELMAAVAERQPSFDDLLASGDELVKADTEIAASSALKLELFQAENRWKSIRLRLAKWAKQLGLDKDFYKLLADLLGWLAMAEEAVDVPNPSVTHFARIDEMLNNLTELQTSSLETQRPRLAEVEHAQAQLQSSARDGSDEDKEQADHANRELSSVKDRMDDLDRNLDAKIKSLQSEPLIKMERSELVEAAWDFDQFLGQAPPSGGDNADAWLTSAEGRLGRPVPAYTVDACALRVQELEALCDEVDERRPGFAAGEGATQKDSVDLRTKQRFADVDSKSKVQLRETMDTLRKLRKLAVDTKQVEFWLQDVRPTADLVASGDQIDGASQKDVEIARKQLPNYQLLLAGTTVGAELMETDGTDSPDGAGSLDQLLKKLRRLSDEMADVAEKLLGVSEGKLEQIALLLGSIDDEHRRLMNWLADLTVIVTQPLPTGDAIDYVAIEADIRSANEISTSLEDTNKPERVNFTGKCNEVISQFGGSSDGHNVAGKRDELNDTWDETIELCRRRLAGLLKLQTDLPTLAVVEGMPPPPPASRNASAQELLDWLNSFDIPKATVGDAENCTVLAAYVQAVDKYLAMKSPNYLAATDPSQEGSAGTVSELDAKWSTTQETAKALTESLPKLTEESREFEALFLPLFGLLTAAQALVTGPVQDGDVEYSSTAVMDKLRQCKDVQDRDWQNEMITVHQAGELLATRYDKDSTCSTPPLRMRLHQLAALLSTVESCSQTYRQSLLTVIDTWNGVDSNELELQPVLRNVEQSRVLSEGLPSSKAGVDDQLRDVQLFLATLKDFERLAESFRPLYQELCKHYPPLSIEPLHPIIERNCDAYTSARRRVDNRMKEIDLALLWYENILDRLKKTLLWIDERQKLLGSCRKCVTYDGVVMAWPSVQHPDQLELVAQQTESIGKAISSADRYLKLGRESLQADLDNDKDAALSRPEGLDKEHLNDVEVNVSKAHTVWRQLRHSVKTWDDAMHLIRRLHGDFMPMMKSFDGQLTEAEKLQEGHKDPATRDKNKLSAQVEEFQRFEAQLMELQSLCDVVTQRYRPLSSDRVVFADDLQRDYQALQPRLDELRQYAERRGKLLSMAQDRTDAWAPDQALPGSWMRTENGKLVPFFFDCDQCVVQWEHPVLHEWRLSLSKHNSCHFAAFRTALKLRELRRKSQLNSCSFRLVQEVIHERGLEHQNDTYISVLSAGNTLSLLYEKMGEQGLSGVKDDESTDVLLSWLFSVFDTNRSGQIRAGSLKLFLVLMCNGMAADKIKWLASQQVDALGYLERRTVANLLYDANMLTKFVFELAHFSNNLVEQAVDDCFRQGQAAKASRVIRPAELAKWLSMQPRALRWLWALEKLNRSEQVDHDMECVLCHRPILGLRYRCKKHTSDNICQECFWEGKTNRTHKLYHLVQEYTTQASVGERMRDVTQSFKRKGRASLHREGAEETKDFNVLQFLADADHQYLPKTLSEAFMEVYPTAAAHQKASSPARFPAESPASPHPRHASTPPRDGAAQDSALQDSVLLASLDEDAKHLQMLIDQRQKLIESLPAVEISMPQSSRLQQLLEDQLKEEISVLEVHHAKAVTALEAAKNKGGGYRPGHRDFPDSPSPVDGSTPSPRPDYPIFDLLDVFCTQVSSSLTGTARHDTVEMAESYGHLCNGLQETAGAMSGIVRVATTAASTNSSGGLNETSAGAPSTRYYVSECGSEGSKSDPHRIQLGREPPMRPWRAKFMFMAFAKEIPGTRKIFVLKAENPLRYRLSLRNQFGRWKDVFSFHAYGSPGDGRVAVFVSTRGTDDSAADPLRFLLSDGESERNAALQQGWTASFTFYAPQADSANGSSRAAPSNGHVNGSTASSLMSPVTPTHSNVPRGF